MGFIPNHRMSIAGAGRGSNRWIGPVATVVYPRVAERSRSVGAAVSAEHKIIAVIGPDGKSGALARRGAVRRAQDRPLHAIPEPEIVQSIRAVRAAKNDG